MKADGSVIIRADIDVDEAEKDLAKLKSSIHKTENEIENLSAEKAKAEEKSVFSAAELDAEKAKLEQMKNELKELRALSKDTTIGSVREEAKAAIPGKQIDVSDQATRVRLLQTEYNKINNEVDRYARRIDAATQKLDRQTEEAGDLASKINSVSRASVAMKNAQEKAQKSMARFGRRMSEVVRSALVFTIITQSLAKFREWFGKVINTSEEARESFARLKGALLTLAQPLMSVVVPAFVFLVNLLTAVVSKIAQLTAALFGMTANEAAKAAEALNKESEGLENVGKASKKAGKSLASFDEINKLAGSDNGGVGQDASIAPDFSWATGVEGVFSRLAEYVLLIGAGLAIWKISAGFPGVLGRVLTTIGGISVAVGGLFILWEGLSSAWESGINWENFIVMVGGATAAVLGLWKAFGRIGGGIGLIVSGVALLVTGFKDVMDNGFNLQNTLTALAGVISTGLGLSWLVKGPIPAVIAAIGAILIAITVLTGNGEQLIGNLKQIFSGLVTFIDGIVNGDVNQILSGLKAMVFGVLNTVLTIFGSLVNAVIKGIGWLVDRINAIRFTVPDWAPGIGGKSMGFNLPKPKEWKIPQLAQGAVIPPNREFMAVLGDQKSGTNIETPLSTMIEAFTAAMQNMGMGGGQTVIMQIDGREFGRFVNKYGTRESNRVGVSLAGGMK